MTVVVRINNDSFRVEGQRVHSIYVSKVMADRIAKKVFKSEYMVVVLMRTAMLFAQTTQNQIGTNPTTYTADQDV